MIDVYNDAVEIRNAGWFIEGQDPEEHLAGRNKSPRTRNALIARTLYRSQDIENYGTGILRIRELCDQKGIRVEYRHDSNGTCLVFHRRDAFEEYSASLPQARREIAANEDLAATLAAKLAANEDLAATLAAKLAANEDLAATLATSDPLTGNEVAVLDILASTTSTDSKEVATTLGMPMRTARYVLSQLAAKQLAEPRGADRNRTYRLKGGRR